MNSIENPEIFISTRQEAEEFARLAYQLRHDTVRDYRYRYDQFCLPSGKSHDGKHTSQICLIRYEKERDAFFVLLEPYCSRYWKDNDKEKKNKPEGETPEQTAIREAWEETGAIVTKLIMLCDPETRPSDPGKGIKEHDICRFAGLEWEEGTIKYFPDFYNPNDRETGQPFWLKTDLISYRLPQRPRPQSFVAGRHMKTVELAVEYYKENFEKFKELSKVNIHDAQPVTIKTLGKIDLSKFGDSKTSFNDKWKEVEKMRKD